MLTRPAILRRPDAAAVRPTANPNPAAQRAAHAVLSLYGERLEDYLAEFKREAKNA